jgi:hypothetical protein
MKGTSGTDGDGVSLGEGAINCVEVKPGDDDNSGDGVGDPIGIISELVGVVSGDFPDWQAESRREKKNIH